MWSTSRPRHSLRPGSDAVRGVARKQRLPNTWLNDLIGDFLRGTGTAPEGTLWRTSGMLAVYVPPSDSILALKLFAGRPKDREDIASLCQLLQIQTLAQAQQLVDRSIPNKQVQQLNPLEDTLDEWFGYAREQRAQLVADPLALPETPDPHALRWATFCAAPVEWLCEHYGMPCPSWVHHDASCLPEPWFDSPGAHKPQVREQFLQQTPEPFTRRNIFCGNRMFANTYAFAEHYQQFALVTSAATPVLS